DTTLDTFTRQEAAELIPKSNPFLRKLFGYISGPDIDDRIKWIVDSLADVFLATNVEAILKNYGKSTKMEDPIIHFYETFLTEYDPKLRKSRGVWYTPQPVVNFIVRAVDDILKTEFDLPQGLADTSKTTIKVNSQSADKRSVTGYKQVDQEVHKVQILDPATGTGTFLAEVIKLIHKKFEGQQGIWSNYVETHLLPRLNGFELLMASYAMAHLKLELLLKEFGYNSDSNQRLKVFLTNSLEQASTEVPNLFMSQWLTEEAIKADFVKRDTPVMCIIGNPPYSVSSTNKGEWIENLTADYKKDLNERNIQPLSDDYIKFIRYGQHFIDKNGSGILAYISNNSFIDGIIHRQMRKHLLECFDNIYILDLHGSTKKNETTLDGSKDENVFDIMQGVSINIFVKTGKKKKNQLGKVFHSEIYGKRDFKYAKLSSNSLNSIQWQVLDANSPNFFFINKNFEERENYEKGFKIDDLFIQLNAGLATEFDALSIKNSKREAEELLNDLKNKSAFEVLSKYQLKTNKIGKVENAVKDIAKNKPIILSIDYRPFDSKYTIYTGVSNGIMGRPRDGIMKHMLHENIALLTCRQQTSFDFQHVFISNKISERCSVSLQTGEVNYIFPIYLYPETTAQQTIDQTTERIPNLNAEIVKQLADKLGLIFTNEKDTSTGSLSGSVSEPVELAPIDILDYIYAVLHSPTYREKYKEFLKIDFPRVPYPKGKDTFWQLVKLGGEIRQIHLLESPVVEQYITQYPVDGDNIVGRPKYSDGKVYINDMQYFDNVPQVAWEFYIGGYQPAQKWLKDRKGRKLEFEDILHYQKIIVALSETGRLMKEIDGIEIE
ncbi:MAG: type ISP restriction/modification enzyme, partial [Tenuifilaceae bacterium]|nr:type ISP restriction/modification enzyme [Tenuifilaceae bacterium]